MEVTWNIPKQLLDTEVDATIVDFRFPGTKNIPIVSATRKIQY